MVLKYLVLLCLAYYASGANPVLHNLGTMCISHVQPKPDSNGKYPSVAGCDEKNCSGRLWIYFSDSNQTQEWGTVNADQNMGLYTRDVACRQLGYEKSKDAHNPEPPPLENGASIPVWLTAIDCGNYPGGNLENADEKKYHQNVLNCDKEIWKGEKTHSNDVILSCVNKLHLDESSYYDGEVFLSPPKEKPDGMQTSIGVVQLKLKDAARSISIQNPADVAKHFSSVKRNAICKQMGYTGTVPDSVYSVPALKNNFNFSHHIRSAWFQVSDLKDYCNQYTPVPCFSCCYDYPHNTTGCPSSICIPEKALIISCYYDTVSEQINSRDKGNEYTCSFHNEKINKNAGCNHSKVHYEVGFIVVIIPCIVLVIIVIPCCCKCYRKNVDKACELFSCRCNGYERVPDDKK